MMMTQQAFDENGSMFQHRSQTTNGDGHHQNINNNNNNNNNISVNSKATNFGNNCNMFEMFDKGKGSAAMLPSFLSFQPIPESKIFSKPNRESFTKVEFSKVVGNQTKPVSVIKGSNPTKNFNAIFKANRLTAVTNGFKCSNPVPHVADPVKPNHFVSISSNENIRVKKLGSLMPPPPPSIKTSTCKTIYPSKVVKKRTLTPAVSQKPGVATTNINSLKRYSCAECDLGVTFRNKLDLQHHQSGWKQLS